MTQHCIWIIPLLLLAACRASAEDLSPNGPRAKEGGIAFSSSDRDLAAIFDWAKATALRYVGKDTDPVGPWYEAALPGREAFCIRDVAHQCLGAEILGLGRHNRNMLRRFVDGIAESRDYCSYWEIDRLNRPAPVDYESDEDFWYPLNANFDLIDACYRLYQWSGDAAYLNGTEFDRFYRLTLNEYIGRWHLQPNRIADRPGLMNLKPAATRFRQTRGLPSYDELQGDLAIGSDLVGMVYNALRTYANILAARKQTREAERYRARAAEYKRLLDSAWWDDRSQSYYAFRTVKQEYRHGGVAGSEFLLWCGAIDDPIRIEKALRGIRNTQVEVLSYLPMLYYRYGFGEEGREFLAKLAADPRRDYPEAPFAAIEAIVRGLMGIEPAAGSGVILTCPRLCAKVAWAEARDVPTFAGPITVRHSSATRTTFTNGAGRAIKWRAEFQGAFDRIIVDGKTTPAKHRSDSLGHPMSYVDIGVARGAHATAEALPR